MDFFAQKLRELRAGLMKTQKQAANMVGIAPTTLSAYENGTKIPVLDVAVKIAEAYGISLDWLCGRDAGNGEPREIETLGDVIQQLSRILHIRTLFSLSSYDDTGHVIASIDTTDGDMVTILLKWADVLRLYHDGTIDDDMYGPWLTKQIEKYSSIPLHNTNQLGNSDNAARTSFAPDDDDELPF